MYFVDKIYDKYKIVWELFKFTDVNTQIIDLSLSFYMIAKEKNAILLPGCYHLQPVCQRTNLAEPAGSQE